MISPVEKIVIIVIITIIIFCVSFKDAVIFF
jgi:hypothetical protein